MFHVEWWQDGISIARAILAILNVEVSDKLINKFSAGTFRCELAPPVTSDAE